MGNGMCLRARRQLGSAVAALLLAGGALAAEPGEGSEQKAPIPQEQGIVLVTGVPSVIELSDGFIGDDPPRCIDFRVSIVGKLSQELRITSTGIAGARLRPLNGTDAAEDCAESGDKAQTAVVIQNAGATEQLVRLFIPASAFPTRPEGSSGKLVFVRLDAPVTEQTIALQRESPPYQGVLVWLAGGLTPVALGGIGLLVKVTYERRKSDRAELEEFRRQRGTDLGDFFGGLYKSTVELESDDEYQKTMERELHEGVFRGMPADQLNHLREIVRKRDRKEAGRVLA